MKKSLLYLSVMALGLAGVATSCDDDFERPPMVVPTASIEANTTIAELKADFYNPGSNYATEVGTKADGSHYIISGYVTTSDEAGNYFKQVVIQDETSAVQIGIDAYDLYESYQMGQEVVIDVTGLYVGTYGKLFQIGAAPSSGYPSRISEESIAEHAQVNGLASESNIEPTLVTISQLLAMTPSSEEGLEWQNRLIRIDGVTFANAGKQTLSTSGSNGVSQNFGNADGSVILYTSGYSNFYDYYCPTGTGDVVGILSCYNASWQIRLIDIDGLIGFDELVKADGNTPGTPDTPPTDGEGTEAKPYGVDAILAGATGTDVWSKGYIVGWVEGQVLAEGAHFDATSVSVLSNILIAATADCKDVAKCVPVQLPTGDIRNALNLKDHPGYLGKEVMLKGNLEKYFGAAGIKSTSAYKIEGVDNPDTPDTPAEPVSSINETFEASSSIPAGWTQCQVAGNKTWYIANFQENNYAAMTGYKGTAPFDQYLITPPVDMTKVTDKTLSFVNEVNGYGSKTSKIEVMVLDGPDPKTAKATVLNAKWATAPASGYSDWMSSGNLDLSGFTGTIYIAFRYSATADANFATWCIDNVKLNAN